jgi:hypothetical protein
MDKGKFGEVYNQSVISMEELNRAIINCQE